MQSGITSKMAVMPIKRLMLNMGIPMILSMVLQAAYNIVDSAFVANMSSGGEQALNALTLAFPVQLLIVAVGIGTGVGANALASKCLGARDIERAGKTAGNAVFLSAVIYILFLLFGLFGSGIYIRSQTNDPVIAQMGIEYLTICCVVSFGIIFFSTFEKLLQATGRSMFSTIAQIAGAVVNIIFDPILIYGMFGLPEFGVKGAAYATVFGQIVSFAVALIFHLKFNKELKIKTKYLRPDAQTIKNIYAIGVPAIISQALTSVMTYGLNIIFVKINTNVVTAYGLFYKIQQFILFAAFGLRDAITPIVSFSHGFNSKRRVIQGIKYGVLYTSVIMVAGTLALEIFAQPFSAVFGLSGETRELCVWAMKIISISFLFAGLNIALQGVFQALNSGIASLVISVCRQILFVLPVAWAFSLAAVSGAASTELVWLTFPIAEALTAAIACVLMRRVYKKQVTVLGDHIQEQEVQKLEPRKLEPREQVIQEQEVKEL